MELKWTGRALSDLARLHKFLASVNQQEAARTVQALTRAPVRLLEHPRIGEKLEDGAVVTDITRDTVRFSRNGQRYYLVLREE